MSLKDIKEKKARNIKFIEILNEYPRFKAVLLEKLEADMNDLKDELARGETLSLDSIRIIQGEVKALYDMYSVVLKIT